MFVCVCSILVVFVFVVVWCGLGGLLVVCVFNCDCLSFVCYICVGYVLARVCCCVLAYCCMLFSLCLIVCVCACLLVCVVCVVGVLVFVGGRVFGSLVFVVVFTCLGLFVCVQCLFCLLLLWRCDLGVYLLLLV